MSLRMRPNIPNNYTTNGFRSDHLLQTGNVGLDHRESFELKTKKGLSRLSPTKHTVRSHKRKADGKKESKVSEYVRGNGVPDTGKLSGVGSRDTTDILKKFIINFTYFDDDRDNTTILAKDYKSALSNVIDRATEQLMRVDLRVVN